MSQPDFSKAIALGYDGHQAPEVIAKGDAELAAEILAIAEDHQVPVCNNPLLADLLFRLEVGEHIHRELYLSVAHIIAFVYRTCGEQDALLGVAPISSVSPTAAPTPTPTPTPTPEALQSVNKQDTPNAE